MDAIEELANLLKDRPFFALFKKDELLDILTFAVVEHVSFGKYVFKEGDEAKDFYFVFSGKFKMTKYVDGKEIALRTILEGNHFGEQCLFENTPYVSSVISSGDSILIRLPKEEFTKYIENKPEVTDYIKDYIKNMALNNFIRLATGFGAKVPLKHLTLLIQNLKKIRR